MSDEAPAAISKSNGNPLACLAIFDLHGDGDEANNALDR